MSPELEAHIEEHRNINVEHHDWWEFTYEDFSNRMEERGISVDEIEFSGFWSQGDGASFTGFVRNADMQKFMEAEKLTHKYESAYVMAGFDQIGVKIERSSRHYCHSNTVSVSLNDDLYNPYDDGTFRAVIFDQIIADYENTILALEKEVTTIMRGHMDKLYAELEETYNDMTSDEQVLETLTSCGMIPDEILDTMETVGSN